jgi:5-epi-alpha-selinene synthase
MDHLLLPDLYCPFPAAVNRHVEIVDRQTVQWARQFNLAPNNAAYRRLEATRLGWLAARTHPDAPLEELQLVADWCAWLFVRDDYCDESGVGRQPERFTALHDDFLRLLKGAPLAADAAPLLRSLCDLRDRTRAKASVASMRRLIEHIADFFAAGAWEATNRAEGVTPDVTTYINMRPHTSGMYAFIELSAIVERIDLPLAVRTHPTVERLTFLATIVACWMNDLISFRKELRQGDVHNLVLTLRHKYHLSLDEAIERAAALHDAQVRAFIDLEQRLPVFEPALDARLRQYVAVLRSTIRGNLDWSKGTARYVPLQDVEAPST